MARWLVDVGLTYGVPAEQLIHLAPGIDHEMFAVRTPLDDRPIGAMGAGPGPVTKHLTDAYGREARTRGTPFLR